MKFWRSIWLIILLIILFLGVPFLLVNWNDIQPMIASLTKGQFESIQKKDTVEKKETKETARAEPTAKEIMAEKPVIQGAEISNGEKGKVLGLAPKGWKVNLKKGSDVIGSAVANKTNGQWIVIVDKKYLTEGKHSFALEALSPDNKNTLISLQSLEVTVSEDKQDEARVVILEEGKEPVVLQKGKTVKAVAANTASPAKQTKKAEPEKPKETLEVGSLDYKATDNGQIDLVAKGAGTAGETIKFFVNNKSIGSIKVDNSGQWMFEKKIPLDEGNHQFKVTQGSETAMRTMTYRPVPEETSSIAKVSEEVEQRRKAVRAANLAKEAEEKAGKTETEEKKPVSSPEPAKEKAKEAVKKPVQAPVEVKEPVKQVAEKVVKAEKVETENTVKSEEKENSELSKPIKVKTRSVAYTVIRGDSLWDISDKHYGEGVQYWRIYKRNRTKIRTPDLIYPGQKFIIP